MSIKDFLKKIFYKIIDSSPFFYRPEYKIYNHRFEINKTDKDIWPSYPHIHFLEDSLKLNIYTGDVYRIITRDIIAVASKKDMNKLWNDRKFLEIVLESRRNKLLNVKKLERIPIQWLNNENKEWIRKYE